MFSYDAEVTERFPTIRAGVVHATGLANDTDFPGLLDEYRAEQRAAADRLSETAIADLPSISAWRRVFTAFGAKPTQHRNAAESLLRRLSKKGDIPSINPLVDIGNLVSIRYALPVAVLDLANISGATTVCFARGNETFSDLGSSENISPESGEVIFTDKSGVVSARRWCWRQSAGSATSPSTTEALFVVEGHHDGAERDTGSAATDLDSLLSIYQPGCRTGTYHLSPTNPTTT